MNILHLVIYYNDDFGIDPGDHFPARKMIVYHWLLEMIWGWAMFYTPYN